MAELPIQLPEITAPVFAPLPGLTPPALPASIRPINEELDLQEALMRSAEDMAKRMKFDEKALMMMTDGDEEVEVEVVEQVPAEEAKTLLGPMQHPFKMDKDGKPKLVYVKQMLDKTFYSDFDFARDATGLSKFMFKYGPYMFGSFGSQYEFFEFMDKIKQTNPSELQFHEVIMNGMPQRLFCDLDGEFDLLGGADDVFYEGPKITAERILTTLIEILGQCFTECNMGKFDKDKLRILSSCTTKKLSLHLLYGNDRVFRNHSHQLQFWKYVMNKIEQINEFFYIKNNANGVPQMKCILDLAVYRSNGTLRMAGCTKKEDPNRVLIPVKYAKDFKKNVKIVPTGDEVLDTCFLVTCPDSKDFYDMLLPKYEPAAEARNEGSVAAIVEAKTGCRIKETKGRIFVLENPPAGRNCLVTKGECHKSNHGYVIWSRTCLTYKCHSDGCKDKSGAVIHQFTMKKAAAGSDSKLGWQDIGKKKVWGRDDLHQAFAACLFKMASKGDYAWGVYGHGAEKDILDYQLCPNGKMPWKPDTDQDIDIKIIEKDGSSKDSTLGTELSAVKDDHSIIKQYYSCVFEPYCEVSTTSTDMLNMFTPFQHIGSKHIDKERVQIILDALRDITCNKNYEAYEYVVKWLAHLVQKPGTKCGTCLIFKTGHQQAGLKSLFFDCFMPEVIGRRYYRYMEDCNQVNDSFNAMAEMKLLTFIDELPEGVEAKANINKLKAMATARFQTIRKMRTDAYSFTDCNRIVAATNHSRLQLLEMQDMRWQCIETGCATKEYAAKVAEAMGFNSHREFVDSRGASSFFQFLKSVPIDDWNPTKFTETTLRKEMIMHNQPNYVNYVIELLKKRENGNYARFVSYCKDMGAQPLGARAFFANVRKIVPIEWVKQIRLDGVQRDGIQIVPPKPTATDTVEIRTEQIIKLLATTTTLKTFADSVRQQIKEYQDQVAELAKEDHII